MLRIGENEAAPRQSAAWKRVGAVNTCPLLVEYQQAVRLSNRAQPNLHMGGDR